MNTRKFRQDIQDTALLLVDSIAADKIAEYQQSRNDDDSWSLEEDQEMETLISLYEEDKQRRKKLSAVLTSEEKSVLRGVPVIHELLYLVLQALLSVMFWLTVNPTLIWGLFAVVISQALLSISVAVRLNSVDRDVFSSKTQKIYWSFVLTFITLISLVAAIVLAGALIFSLVSVPF